jgi:regulator of protease activity HflC (stomatin/prohibitin superfamily)
MWCSGINSPDSSKPHKRFPALVRASLYAQLAAQHGKRAAGCLAEANDFDTHGLPRRARVARAFAELHSEESQRAIELCKEADAEAEALGIECDVLALAGCDE